MVYRPYNLLGPKLINAIVEQIEEAQKAGSRAIVLRSGLRHFSAGAELALACDYISAASSAKIGSFEATLGLHPLLGGIQRQVQRIGALRAKEMSMLARRYDAPTLEKWGLINLTVPEESLEKATMA